MPKIFINYRRSDTKSEARLLYHALIEKFPRKDVVIDIDSISPTADVKEYLDQAVAECDFLLAVIGPRWIESGDIHNDADWVRIEIEAAIAAGKKIMPIIVNQATMPRPDLLPKSLQPFAYKNGLPLDTGQDFGLHLERIANWIEKLAGEEKPKRRIAPNRSKGRRPLTQAIKQRKATPKEGEPMASRVIEDPFGNVNQLYQIGDWGHYRKDSHCYFWYGDGEIAVEAEGHLQAWRLRAGGSEYLIIHGEKMEKETFRDRFWKSSSRQSSIVIGKYARCEVKGFLQPAKERLTIVISPESICITDNSGFGTRIELPRYEAVIHHTNYLKKKFDYR